MPAVACGRPHIAAIKHGLNDHLRFFLLMQGLWEHQQNSDSREVLAASSGMAEFFTVACHPR